MCNMQKIYKQKLKEDFYQTPCVHNQEVATLS